MTFIEIIGFPGSGKTYLLKKITNEIEKKKSKQLEMINTYLNILAKTYLIKFYLIDFTNTK